MTAQPPQDVVSSSSFLTFVAVGVLGGLAFGAIEVVLHWVNGTGQWLFALVGSTALGVALAVFVWLVRNIEVNPSTDSAPGARDPIIDAKDDAVHGLNSKQEDRRQ